MAQPSSHRLLAARLLTALAVLALPAAAAATASTASAAARGHEHASRAKGVGVRTTDGKYGHILVTSAGRTLYVLVSGSGASLPCKGTCASLWPPLVTAGKPHGVKGIRTKLLGTAKLGKKRQVTYDHHPLYRYAGDSGRGQINGEGVQSFGGTWYVVGTKGSPVKGTLTSSGGGGGSGGYGGYGGSSSGGGSGGSGGGW